VLFCAHVRKKTKIMNCLFLMNSFHLFSEQSNSVIPAFCSQADPEVRLTGVLVGFCYLLHLPGGYIP
jgi:hypothetical protein